MEKISALLHKADKYMETIEMCIHISDFDSAASRAYYAIFYAAEALLLSKGIEVSTHKGVHTKFSELFIKTGYLPKELSVILKTGYDMRQLGDYETDTIITEEDAQQLFTDAQQFIAAIKTYLHL